jgi:hypothetical protein
MARPPAKDLTERELEVMHVFWKHGEATAALARDRLADAGLDRTYTTIANLVRLLQNLVYARPWPIAASPRPRRPCGYNRGGRSRDWHGLCPNVD